jgi:hypothetical protein
MHLGARRTVTRARVIDRVIDKEKSAQSGDRSLAHARLLWFMFVPPNLKLRRAVISVSLTTVPDALDRDGLAE